MRSLLSVVAVAPLLVAQVPVSAEGVADDLGVMSISLKDVLKPKLGIQGQTQGAGTPNQAGIGGFLPLVVGENSTFLLMFWLTQTSGITLIFRALSTPRWLVPLSLLRPAWVIAGLPLIVAGCLGSMLVMTRAL